MSVDRRLRLLFALGLLSTGVLILFVYHAVLDFGFLEGDDHRHILYNIHTHSLAPSNLWWMFSTAEIDYWRPLSFVSHALDFTIWGDAIGGHHATSMIIHVVNATLVGVIGYTAFSCVHLGERRYQAVACALIAAWLFAVHPQNVETVAWLAERKGVLVSMFYLATVWTYMISRGQPGYAAKCALVFALLAMMSKPLAVSLPLTLIMIDIYPLRRLRWDQSWCVWRTVILQKFPFLLMAAAVAAYTYLAVEAGGYINTTEVLTTSDRLINAARSTWIYIWRWFVPLNLSPLYPLEILDNSLSFRNLIAPLALVLAALLAIALWRRGHAMMLGLLGLHMVLLGPVLGLVSVGIQSSADRYAYLPNAWLSVVIAGALVSAWSRGARMKLVRVVMILVLCGWLAGLALIARQQVRVWENIEINSAMVSQVFPAWQSDRYYRAGLRAYFAGDCTAAVDLFKVAIDHKQQVANSNMFLAYCLQRQGKDELALEHVSISLAVTPDALAMLGMAMEIRSAAGAFDAAREAGAHLLALFPGNIDGLRQSALVEIQAGALERAAALLEQARELDDSAAQTHVLLGVAAQRAGQNQRAREAYRRALVLMPDNSDAQLNLRTLDAADAPTQ